MTRSFVSRWKSAAAIAAFSGVALATAATGVLAQDEATPSAGSESTATEPSTGAGKATPAVDKLALTEAIQTLTDTLALVQADRDAVAGSIDVTEIDALIAKATEMRDAAKTALASDDASGAPEAVGTGMQVAYAAHALIDAEASAYGLPSQQSATSRVLVQAYYDIDEAGGALTADSGADAQFFVDTAERLYTKAYDLYNAGTYAQAAKTAAVAEQLVGIALAPTYVTEFGAITEPGYRDKAVTGEPGDAIEGESGVVTVPGDRIDPNDPGAFQVPDVAVNGDISVMTPDAVFGDGPFTVVIDGPESGSGGRYGDGMGIDKTRIGGTIIAFDGLNVNDTPLEVPAPDFN